MKKFLKYVWENLEITLVMVFFAAILITVTVQILARLVFNYPLMFTEELARFLYLWMVFLGFPYITKKGKNLCLELVTNKIKGKKKCVFDIIINLFSIAAFIFIGYWSIEFIKFSWINPAPAMRFSLGIVYLCAPVAMGLCIVRCTELIVKDILKISGKLPLDELETTPEKALSTDDTAKESEE